MKTESIFDLGLSLGLFLIFVGIGIQFFVNESLVVAGSILSTLGFIIILRFYLRKKRPDSMKKDERSRKIGAFSASWSWIVTVFALMIMFWVNRLNIFPLGANEVIGLTYITMVASLIVLKYHFNKKGDVL